MDRYQFENYILDYLDNTLTIAKRKEFEDFMKNDPEAKALVDSVQRLKKQMKHLPAINTSPQFIDRLQGKITEEKLASKIQLPQQTPEKRTILGFTPMVSGLLAVTFIALVFVSIQLLPDRPVEQGSIPSQGLSNIQPPAANTGTFDPVLDSSKDELLAESEEDSVNSDEAQDKEPYSLEDKIQFVKNPQ
jgi:hypothetical protein